jgi:hypothetical protein
VTEAEADLYLSLFRKKEAATKKTKKGDERKRKT